MHPRDRILDESGNLSRSERQELVRQLLSPGAYAHNASHIRHIETHISDLFLAGGFVYKVKKPVDLQFVNFVSLADRERYVRIELEINQALTTGVYLGVSEVRRTPQGEYSMDGPGETVDFALRMRRLRSEDALDERLGASHVAETQIAEVAETIARFHRDAAVCERDSHALIDRISRMTQQNFDTLEVCADLPDRDGTLSEIRAYTRAFLSAKRDAFASRVAAGRIRDGHGDLHAANIFFCPELQIIDRIEFDPGLRCIDVAADIAFLAMDLEHRGRPDLATLFLERYESASADQGCVPFLNFYRTYRAMVRAKIACLRVQQGAPALEETFSYRDLARTYVEKDRPQVAVVMCGFSGAGKSTIARALAKRWQAERYSSDVVRKTIAGIPIDEPAAASRAPELYSADMTQRTYEALIEHGDEALAKGRSVILDATFAQRSGRIAMQRAAHRRGVRTVLVECVVDEATQRARLAGRTSAEAEGSDATVDLMAWQRSRWNTVEQSDADAVVHLDTSGQVDGVVERASTAIWDAALRS